MLAYAIAAGQELLAVKKGLPHGQFQSWCAVNLSFTDRQARNYMRLAKTELDFRFDEEVSLNAALEALATPKAPSAFPTLTRDDASRILKLAASANGGNVHEEAVAQDILDKMAARFGMTGEEAQGLNSH